MCSFKKKLCARAAMMIVACITRSFMLLVRTKMQWYINCASCINKCDKARMGMDKKTRQARTICTMLLIMCTSNPAMYFAECVRVECVRMRWKCARSVRRRRRRRRWLPQTTTRGIRIQAERGIVHVYNHDQQTRPARVLNSYCNLTAPEH